jgi:hypothetical protein
MLNVHSGDCNLNSSTIRVTSSVDLVIIVVTVFEKPLMRFLALFSMTVCLIFKKILMFQYKGNLILILIVRLT